MEDFFFLGNREKEKLESEEKWAFRAEGSKEVKGIKKLIFGCQL